MLLYYQCQYVSNNNTTYITKCLHIKPLTQSLLVHYTVTIYCTVIKLLSALVNIYHYKCLQSNTGLPTQLQIISQRLDVSETKTIRETFIFLDPIHLDNCLVDEVVPLR